MTHALLAALRSQRFAAHLAALALLAGCQTTGCFPDMIHAVGDEVTIVGRSPAERAARVARLSPCEPFASAPADWPVLRLRPLPGTLRLPPGFTDRPDEVPSSDEQMWVGPNDDDVTLQITDRASLSTGFMVGPGLPNPIPTRVDEGTCAARFGGRLAAVLRMYWVRGSAPSETTFVAVTDIPIAADSELGAGVVARSRGARDSLLAGLATMRFEGHDTKATRPR